MLAALFVVLAAGCGEPAEEADTAGADSISTGEAAVDTTAAVEAEVVLYPEGTIDPATLTPDEPVSAAALYQAWFAWNGKPVTVVAYPYVPYMRDTISVETELELIGDPASTEPLATAIFTVPAGVILNAGEPVAICGTLEMSWTGELEILDAALAETPAAVERIETSPWVYDGRMPIPVDQLSEMVHALVGREVTVEGTYHSTTTSTTDFGVTVRVDLADPSDEWTKLVGCEMAGEIPAASDTALSTNREGVMIRGIVAGESFDMVALEGCVLINR